MVVSHERGNDQVFHALADATRRDIVSRVLQRGYSISELAQLYPMSFAAVQKHVTVLERAELIVKERRGREQVVHGNIAALRESARLFDTYEQIWRQRAAAIAEILTEENPKGAS